MVDGDSHGSASFHQDERGDSRLGPVIAGALVFRAVITVKGRLEARELDDHMPLAAERGAHRTDMTLVHLPKDQAVLLLLRRQGRAIYLTLRP